MKQENKKQSCKEEKNVKITLNGEKSKIESGTYIVSDLKAILSIPTEYELEIVEDGQFRPLDDNEDITICDKEEFVSHVKCGGSS